MSWLAITFIILSIFIFLLSLFLWNYATHLPLNPRKDRQALAILLFALAATLLFIGLIAFSPRHCTTSPNLQNPVLDHKPLIFALNILFLLFGLATLGSGLYLLIVHDNQDTQLAAVSMLCMGILSLLIATLNYFYVTNRLPWARVDWIQPRGKSMVTVGPVRIFAN